MSICFVLVGLLSLQIIAAHRLTLNDQQIAQEQMADEAGTGKLCKQGLTPPPACCCKRVLSEKDCLSSGPGKVFHPAVQPRTTQAAFTKTCSATSWCCSKSGNHLCPSGYNKQIGYSVLLKSFDNLGGDKKVYLKIYTSELINGQTWVEKMKKISPKCLHAEKPCQLRQKLFFKSMEQNFKVNFELKKKGMMFGATSMGKVEVGFGEKEKYLSKHPVDLDFGEVGKVHLEMDFTVNMQESKWDQSLCVAPQPSNSDPSTVLPQNTAQIGDDIDSIFDDVGGGTSAGKTDHLKFLDILQAEPNQNAGSSGAGNHMFRDYTLIVDRSGSMNLKDEVHMPDIIGKKYGGAGMKTLDRWTQVEAALQYLAPFVVDEDPDGIGVIFFDNDVEEHSNICSDKDVMTLFRANRPKRGMTYLAEALKDAMEPDTIGRAETIFVLTDGAASDPRDVKSAIIRHTKKMCKNEELSISFIQVGSDGKAAKYLNELDDDLEKSGAKFDIVDAMTKDEMEGKSFLDVVQMSIHD